MARAEKLARIFWMVGGIEGEMSAKFVNYIYDCAAEGKTAIVVISSCGGDTRFINSIIDTLRATDVKLITIAYGMIQCISTAVFCQGDERYLADGTDLGLRRINPTFDEFYLEKTGISKKVFLEATEDSGDWYVPEEEVGEFGFITGTYSNAVELMVESYRQNTEDSPMVNPFTFYDELKPESARDILEYILCCAAHGTEAFVEINSGGGNIACLSAIVSTLESSKVKLTTIGAGFVASSAAALFLMGDRRVAKENTTFIIHEARENISEGRTLFLHDAVEIMEELIKATNLLVSCYTKKTTISIGEFNRRTRKGRDWYVEPDEFSIITDKYEDVVKEIINIRRK